MWNDTDIPLAYLITFRCHGTWLHGDERGSIDRFHNQYKSPYIPPNSRWQEHNTKNLVGEPVTLAAQQRIVVENAIRETCTHRGWLLRAINVRTNHVHVVVSVGLTNPRRVLNGLKSYSTRALRRHRCWTKTKSPWADKGSERYLWNERSVGLAVDYVVNGQGGELPEFD